MAGSSLWVFGLAVILNSIELSSQSGIPRLQGQGFREAGIPSARGYRPRPYPYRKVRCPTEEQRTVKTTFLIRHANGTFEDCTPDKILLAVGPILIGFILDDGIRPISATSGGKIMYDETNNEQINVSMNYLLKNFNVFGPVPENIRRISVIHPFGVFSPTTTSNPTIPRSPIGPVRPTLARSASVCSPGSHSRFDSDTSSSSSSSATSRSPSRSSKSFLSRIFGCSSSRSPSLPSNEASSSGKE